MCKNIISFGREKESICNFFKDNIFKKKIGDSSEKYHFKMKFVAYLSIEHLPVRTDFFNFPWVVAAP